mmetsp:Transcript_20903/g.31085  ORF Transcript_20903/g.31085 Transcript_20903/m.31085 type:complete len:97 (-) Transcript_20903:661-951(-)
MVLDDITDDTTLVKVSTTSLGAKVFFEGDGDAGNVFVVPEGLINGVGETQDNKILNNLLSKVVINTIDVVLCVQCADVLVERLKGGKIMSKRFLHN